MKDAVIALLAVLVLALATVACGEHRAPNAGLPLVKAQAAPPPPQMLFSPCPLGPRNRLRVAERKA